MGNNSFIGPGVSRLHGGTVTLPLLPNICVVRSGDKGVVCVNGTGTLGGEIDRCFNSRGGRTRGIHEVISGISSFRCVVASDRFRTLVLRYDLVGRRAPGCGVLLGSSGNCDCVEVDSNS